MNDQENKVDTQAAREAAMLNVETYETILEKITTAKPASQATDNVSKDSQETDKPKTKQSAQERIIELANKRREAENSAEEARRENEELKQRLKALESGAPAVKQDNKPQRLQYASEDQYIEALTDWKAVKAIADREEQQRQARMAAEMQDIDSRYAKTVENAKNSYEDFADVVSAATTNIPDFLVMALKESSIGGDLTYYLAKHKDEVDRLLAMRPVQAIKYLDRLERDLLEPSEPETKLVDKVESKAKKKAPEPITPVHGNAQVVDTPAKDYEEYRARRKAQVQRGR